MDAPGPPAPAAVRPAGRPGTPHVALLLAGLLLLGACAEGDRPGEWSGTVELADVALGSLVGGRVVEVRHREGEDVKAGETLVELDPAEWTSALDEATALATATARELDLLRAGPRPEQIAEARAEAKRLELLWTISAQGARPEEIQAAREETRAAEAAALEAEREVTRLQGLARTGREPVATFERAVAARDAAVARRAVHEQRLNLLERGLRPEEVEAARQAWVAQGERVKALESGARREEVSAKEAVLAAAEARIRLARTRLKELTIAAPADGTIQTLDVRPGDLLKPGEPVAVLLLREEPWVTVYVPEGELASVSVGRAAEVVPDGHPPLPGRVTWISRRAEFSPRNVQTRGERVTQVFAVKVVVDGDASALKDGMWADVRLR